VNRIGSNRPGQSLVQAPLHQQRRRSEDDDVKRASGGSVGIPEPLDRVRPAVDLLDLVQDEHKSSAGAPSLMPAFFPDIPQPPTVASIRDSNRISDTCLGRTVRRTSPRVIHRLVPTTSLDNRQCLTSCRRLARLPGAEDSDESVRRLGQPLHDRRHLRALKLAAHGDSLASSYLLL